MIRRVKPDSIDIMEFFYLVVVKYKEEENELEFYIYKKTYHHETNKDYYYLQDIGDTIDYKEWGSYVPGKVFEKMSNNNRTYKLYEFAYYEELVMYAAQLIKKQF